MKKKKIRKLLAEMYEELHYWEETLRNRSEEDPDRVAMDNYCTGKTGAYRDFISALERLL